MKCCNDENCQIVQIMPSGGWLLLNQDVLNQDVHRYFTEPIIGFGLKECGFVSPLVIGGEFDIVEVEDRLTGDDSRLYHPDEAREFNTHERNENADRE